jgi:hypothetical protein
MVEQSCIGFVALWVEPCISQIIMKRTEGKGWLLGAHPNKCTITEQYLEGPYIVSCHADLR